MSLLDFEAFMPDSLKFNYWPQHVMACTFMELLVHIRYHSRTSLYHMHTQLHNYCCCSSEQVHSYFEIIIHY